MGARAHNSSDENGRVKRRIIWLLALAVAALIAFFGVRLSQLQTQIGETERALAETQTATDALQRSVLPADVIDQTSKSVYLVLFNGRALGTAWVLDRDAGILVTAAHLTDYFELFDEPELEIVDSATGARLPIIGAHPHIGFGAFSDLVEEYQPLLPNSRFPRPAPFLDVGCDVALITVRFPEDAAPGGWLGPNLPLAPEEDLYDIKPGDPVAVIGYPADTLSRRYEDLSAKPRVDRGIISAMMNALDIAGAAKQAEAETQLLFRVQMAPGASGGPVVNANGDVIGVMTHGHFSRTTGRAGDGGAQRIDLVYDLLTPMREQRRLKEVYLPAWRERLGAFPKAEEAIPAFLYDRYGLRRHNEASAAEEDEPPYDATAWTAKPEVLAKQYMLDPRRTPRPTPEEREALKEKEEELAKARTLKAEEKSFIRLPGPAYFQEERIFVHPLKHTVIYAFDYNVRRGRSQHCDMRIFWRDDEKELVTATRSEMIPAIRMRPNKMRSPLQTLVFARDERCSDAFDEPFTIGVVSWAPKPKEEPKVSSVIDETIRHASAFVETAPEEAKRLIACTGLAAPGGANCQVQILPAVMPSPSAEDLHAPHAALRQWTPEDVATTAQ